MPPRGSAFALVSSLALTTLVAHARAQGAAKELRTTRVLVSRNEVRVIFPPDTSRTWGWPRVDSMSRTLAPAYYWDMSADAIDGPRTLSLRLHQPDTTARTFPTLRRLVAFEKPDFFEPGMMPRHIPARIGASADGNRVVLTVRDSGAIIRLFGLRPDSVSVSRFRPHDPSFPVSARVAVDYVRPQIPMPDSAFRAEAARARRRYLARINWITRAISGGVHGGAAIWVSVGDSIPIAVSEARCTHDVCAGGREVVGAEWTLDDSSIARVVAAAPRPEVPRIVRDLLPRTYLVARAQGGTVLRVRLPASPVDTMPFQEPPPRTLEREVVVTARSARIEVSPQADTVQIDQPLSVRVRLTDGDGHQIEGAPVQVAYELAAGSWALETTTDALRVTFTQAGTRTIVAKFGTLADTVRVTVVGKPAR
jgi:hypothetical protein